MVKTFVSLVHAHHRVTSAQEDFNDRKTHFVDISQPLSPAALVIAQWANEQSGRDGWRLCTDTTIWTPLTKADLLSLLSSQQRSTLSLQYGAISGG